MIRDTSYQAWRHINDKGLLASRHWQVYNSLYQSGPSTANELHKYMKDKGTAQANDNVSTRLGELRDKGVVTELNTRPCNVTGRNCILWDVTSKLPKKIRQDRLTVLRKRLKNHENKVLKIKREIRVLLRKDYKDKQGSLF